MSSAGQIVGGIVGAVVGFFAYGGPVGAVYGASLGAGIGGALDPPKGPTVEGPRLQDKGIQTSTYGAAVPRIYGTIAGGGNIIQLENNKLKETVRKKSSGGKGGGGSVTTRTYTYSATFQLSLCEGPIAGVRRIWCGDKLIYNAGSDDLETIIASNKAAKGFRVYLGTDDQMPDPRYEAEYGVGNVSAHRGEAYIAFYDFQLADYSNTLQAAQFKVELVGAMSLAVSLHQRSTVAYDAPHSNSSFQPHPWYITPEKILFYAPQWSNDYPPSSSFNVYEFMAGGLARTSVRGVVGIASGDVPPNGTTDDSSEAWASAKSVFGILDRTFAGDKGYLQKRGALYAGIDKSILPITIVATESSGTPNYTITSTTAFAVALSSDGGLVYVVSASAVDIYSGELGVISTNAAIVGAHDIAATRAWVDGSNLWVYDINNPTTLQKINLSSFAVELIDIPAMGTTGAYFSVEFMVENTMMVRAYPGTAPKTITVDWINLATQTDIATSLSSIVGSEVAKSSLLSTTDIDTSLLSKTVRGYRINGGAIRAALEPMQAAFPFDVRQHGYNIQFLPRGQSSVVTIPWADLGAETGDTPGDILQQSREMDSQLPARTAIKYLDAAREYAVSEQYSERLNTEAINRVDRELPLVLTATEAARVAEVLNFLPWLERTDAAFTLPPIYRYLEPGDVVTVTAPQATYELRLTEINETPDGRLECKAKPNRAALYTPAATGAEGVPPTGIIVLGGESLFVPLDIPVVDETLQNAAGFVGVMTGYSAGWPGALAVRSSDDGQTWADLQAYVGKATIGVTVNTLPVSDCTLIDPRTLTVGMISGTPEGITRDQMLAGANYAAYGLDGRWEIVRFQNAALQADGSYLLSGFVRGERGTEWATGLHAAGDYLVLLADPDNAFIGMPVETIGLDRTYRGVTAGDSVDDATDVDFTYRGVNLECLSPCYAKGFRDGSSNFECSFTRRSRLSSSWWATGVAAPVGEASESYDIDVMNGAAVVRTISVTAPSFAYSAANQTTDFGSVQASITFRIYQLSAVVGRGYPLEVTL